MKKIVITILIIFIFSITGFAQISMNIGENGKFKLKNYNMNLDGNWVNTSSDSSSLNFSNSAIIFHGTGQSSITDSSGNFSKLVIQKTDGVVLNSPISITDSLSLISGIFDNSEHEIILSDSAVVDIENGNLLDTLTYTGVVEITYSGSTPVITGNELPSIVDNFTMNNIAGVTLNKSISVDSTLTCIKGNLYTTDSLKITLDSLAIISELDSSYVMGQLQMEPVFVGTDSLNRMGIIITAGEDNIGYVSLERFSGPGTSVVIDTSESINRRWMIASDSLPVSGRDVYLSWSSQDDNNIDVTTAQLWQSMDDSIWIAVGDTQNVSGAKPRVILAEDITQFGSFTVTGGFIPKEIDFNNDGKIDMFDIQMIISRIGKDISNYDLNNSGSVDMEDVKMVIEEWGGYQSYSRKLISEDKKSEGIQENGQQ